MVCVIDLTHTVTFYYIITLYPSVLVWTLAALFLDRPLRCG